MHKITDLILKKIKDYYKIKLIHLSLNSIDLIKMIFKKLKFTKIKVIKNIKLIKLIFQIIVEL